MTEKTKYSYRITSKSSLNKFDIILLTNDGEKYSPSIRRLHQHYFNDKKSFSDKIFLLQKKNSQSSMDLISTSFKCNDCQKHDGLFQCCHCNQHLCIRCCNKHYKKVINEIEHLHELSDLLLIKIFHIKTDLERQKNETIEQCQIWRIEKINTINKAHALIIQTIQDEYEILCKEYDLFVEKEMSNINIDKNQLIKMKKVNLSSLLSSSSTTKGTTTIDSKKSMDTIKQRIETFAKRIDDKGKFSFQVKLPTFDIDDNLRVESCFGDIARSTSAICQTEDFANNRSSIKSEQISKKESSSQENDTDHQSDNYDSNYETASSSSNISLHIHTEDSFPVSTNQFNRRHTHIFHPESSNNTKDKYQNGSSEGVAIQIEQNDGIIRRHKKSMKACSIRRRTTALPIQSSSTNKNHPWLSYRTNSAPPFIQ